MPDPYANKKVNSNIYALKKNIIGNLVVVMGTRINDRGLKLIVQPSRAVLINEIHEVIITSEKPDNGGVINKIAYIGFVEIKSGGVILVGDKVFAEDQHLGYVVGFDETHYPNHLNIVLKSSKRSTGVELGLQLDNKIKFIYKNKTNNISS